MRDATDDCMTLGLTTFKVVKRAYTIFNAGHFVPLRRRHKPGEKGKKRGKKGTGDSAGSGPYLYRLRMIKSDHTCFPSSSSVTHVCILFPPAWHAWRFRRTPLYAGSWRDVQISLSPLNYFIITRRWGMSMSIMFLLAIPNSTN